MARVLIAGCGCRGRALSYELTARGHVVRGTTRAPGRAAEIAAAGAEPQLADPSRVGTLMPVLDGVAVLCLLLGSAVGSAEDLRALHGSRLEMLLSRIVDTPVRGIVYETAGTVEKEVLRSGADAVAAACAQSHIRYALLATAPEPPQEWVQAAAATVDQLLAERP